MDMLKLNIKQLLLINLIIFCEVLICKSTLSDKRLCYDDECKVPVALAKTTIKYTANDPDLLSFPINAPVTVYSKEAGRRTDIWGVEINGKRGYAPIRFLHETKVLHKKKDLQTVQIENFSNDLKNNVKPAIVPTPAYEIFEGTTVFNEPQQVAEEQPNYSKKINEQPILSVHPNVASGEIVFDTSVNDNLNKITDSLENEGTIFAAAAAEINESSKDVNDINGEKIDVNLKNDEDDDDDEENDDEETGSEEDEDEEDEDGDERNEIKTEEQKEEKPENSEVPTTEEQLEPPKAEENFEEKAEEETLSLLSSAFQTVSSMFDSQETTGPPPISKEISPEQTTTTPSPPAEAPQKSPENPAPNTPADVPPESPASQASPAVSGDHNSQEFLDNSQIPIVSQENSPTASIPEEFHQNSPEFIQNSPLDPPPENIPGISPENSDKVPEGILENSQPEVPLSSSEEVPPETQTDSLEKSRENSSPVSSGDTPIVFSENSQVPVHDSPGNSSPPGIPQEFQQNSPVDQPSQTAPVVPHENSEIPPGIPPSEIPQNFQSEFQFQNNPVVPLEAPSQVPPENSSPAEIPREFPAEINFHISPENTPPPQNFPPPPPPPGESSTEQIPIGISSGVPGEFQQTSGDGATNQITIEKLPSNNIVDEIVNLTEDSRKIPGELHDGQPGINQPDVLTGSTQEQVDSHHINVFPTNSNLLNVDKSAEFIAGTPANSHNEFTDNSIKTPENVDTPEKSEEFQKTTENSAGIPENSQKEHEIPDSGKTEENVVDSSKKSEEFENHGNSVGIPENSQKQPEFLDSEKIVENLIDNSEKPREFETPENSAGIPVNSPQIPQLPVESDKTPEKSEQIEKFDEILDKTTEFVDVPEKSQEFPGIPRESEEIIEKLEFAGEFEKVIEKSEESTGTPPEVPEFTGIPAKPKDFLAEMGRNLGKVEKIERIVDNVVNSVESDLPTEFTAPPQPVSEEFREIGKTVAQGVCESQENCPELHEEFTGYGEFYDTAVDQALKFGRNNWEALSYVALTALTTLLFSLGYYYLENSRRDGQFIAKINKLEKELLVATQECGVLDESLKSTKTKLTSIEDESFGSNEMVASLKAELDGASKAKAELEEQVAALEKDLEAATEAGLELERMLREILATNSAENPLAKSIEDLQTRLNAQQTANESLTNALQLKTQENELLSKDLAIATGKCEQLEVELTTITEELKAEKVARINVEQNLTARLEEIEKQYKDVTAERVMLRKQLKGKEMEMKDLLELVKQSNLNTIDIAKLSDVSRAKAEASQLMEERDELMSRLNEVEGAHQLLEEHVKLINEEVASLNQQCKIAQKEKRDAETRLEVLSNFFKEKEAERQRDEAVWLEKQGEVSTTIERLQTMQSEIQSYKQQIESLKREIVDQEKEYKGQITTLEAKAHEQWVLARQNERRLEESKAESAQLRNRLTLIEKNINDNEHDAKLHRLDTNGETAASPLYLGVEASSSPIMFSPPGSANPPPPPPSYLYGPPLPPYLPPPLPPPPPGMSPYDVSQRPPPLGGRLASPPPPPGPRYDPHGSPPPPPHSPPLLPPFGRNFPPYGNERLPPPPWMSEEPPRNTGFHPFHRDQRNRDKGSLHSSGESLDKSHHSGKV